MSPDKIPPEIQEGILDPKMFAERRLYLDPDIIGKPLSSMIQSYGALKWQQEYDAFLFDQILNQKILTAFVRNFKANTCKAFMIRDTCIF